jgi:RNA:NAD 2'-phosphotransferase (TPT1/KptA family)
VRRYDIRPAEAAAGYKRTSGILTKVKQSVTTSRPERPERPEKALAWLLRRGAGTAGLSMDGAGWASIKDVLVVLGTDRATFDDVIANHRATFAVDGDQVRVHEGHWPRSVPVSLAELEASWDAYIPDGSLWYGTSGAKLKRVADHGIVPSNRSHVRLETDPDAAGLRRSGVLLEITPRRLYASGVNVYRARNGVVLVRSVTPSAIRRSLPTPRNRRHFEAELQALLGS